MRDPDAIQRFVDYAEEVPNHIVLPELDIFTQPDFDLNDEKEYEKYLREIEKTVRGSFEYQHMVSYCREYLDMNACSFYANVSNIDTTKIRIELHHEPFSLYDIVSIVVKKRIHFGESLEVEHVAKEVTYNHYCMTVGLIPLAETVHELVHNQYLFIPNDIVFGNWRKFQAMYQEFIPQEIINTLDRIQEYTDACDNDDYKYILAKHYIYYDSSGSYSIPSLEDVKKLLKDRLTELIDKPHAPVEQPKEEKKYYYPIIIDENYEQNG